MALPMDTLKQNLYITYSNQKARDLKQQKIPKPFDSVITLDAFIVKVFEAHNFEILIDEIVATSILYKIIQTLDISYFSYLDKDAQSLSTIYGFILKCHRNDIAFERLLKGDKYQAMIRIDDAYQAYKKKHNLVDLADIEQWVLAHWSAEFTTSYQDIYTDTFTIGDICYIKSKKQEQILDKLSCYHKIPQTNIQKYPTTIIKPANEVFDNIDEVKTAIRIARKLLEDGVKSSDILIVASDIQEYAPLYKLFLDEYALKGFSSIGTPLKAFHNDKNPQVQMALNQYRTQLKVLKLLYERLELQWSQTIQDKLKDNITILDEKIGIEITEPNQIVGLNKHYKHIIFIGTDINHFPPKADDNFLYSYEDELRYFYANNYFTSSQTQLNELKRVSEKLYIITASYSDKRELSPSVLLNDIVFDDTIDIQDIKSVPHLALDGCTQQPDRHTQRYYESILNPELTNYDGKGVLGIDAKHLSASQINKYISCPLAYLYRYKIPLKAPQKSDDGFDVMQQGSLMHLCFQYFGIKVRSLEESSFESVNYKEMMYSISISAYKDFMQEFDMEENIHHKIFLSTLQAGLTDEREAGLLAKFVEYYIQQAEEFEHFRHTEFEKEFALDKSLKPYQLKNEDDENYFIKGAIDRFDNLQEHINIIDYKSKKVKSKKGEDKKIQEKIDTLQDVQLALYLLYAKQLYPNKTHSAYMLSFNTAKPSAHFGILTNKSFNTEYETQLKELVMRIKNDIENGNFGFDNRDEQSCEWCEIKHICHQSILSKTYNTTN